jgi:cathepsin L
MYVGQQEKAFVAWMRENSHAFTGDEYHFRLGIWLGTARFVQEHNAMGTYKVELNKFAAMTPAEYRTMLGVRPMPVSGQAEPSNFAPPESIDWREKGAVNAIKDQGQCGSCWAFSTIQAAEGANFIKYKKLESYSEKNIVDCVATCFGCGGGWPYEAFDWVIGHQGGKFQFESDYPYQPVQGTCKFDASKPAGTITKYLSIVKNDEDDLVAKVAENGPTSICMDASRATFQTYKEGIYDDPKCTKTTMDHAVGLVGYAAEGGRKYWILRNSWGTVWGIAGYMKLLRGVNQCGCAAVAVVPIA